MRMLSFGMGSWLSSSVAGRNRPYYLTGQARAALASRAMLGTNRYNKA